MADAGHVDPGEITKLLEQRGQKYGPPEVNLGCIAAMWSAYICGKIRATGVIPRNLVDHIEAMAPLKASDVAAMMVLTKVSRQVTGEYDADNMKDVQGYAQLNDVLRIQEDQNRF